MKVHRLVVLVVDSDDLGASGVTDVLENTHYPNHRIGPSVIGVDTIDVVWSDDHLLNDRRSMKQAAAKLFGKEA